MFTACTVSSKEELLQIHQLNQQNLKQNLSIAKQKQEGFVSWLYSIELLKKMHELAPSIIIKENDRVVAYALTTLVETSSFHPELQTMFDNLQKVNYKNKPLFSCRFYCMGQICVAEAYRGKGLVNLLYQQHKKEFSSQYDFILTEISVNNPRSLKAQQKTGFEIIYTYADASDEWQVVVWDWK